MTDSKDKGPPDKEGPRKAASEKASGPGGGEETIVLGGSFFSMVEAERSEDAVDSPAGTPDDPFGEMVPDAEAANHSGSEAAAEDPAVAPPASEPLPIEDLQTEAPPAEAQSAGERLAEAMTAVLETPHAAAQAPGASDPEALFRALSERAHDFGFFPLIRRLENHYRDKPRIGESVRPADDPIRLGQIPSVVFAPATLRRFERGEDGKPDRLYGFFLGLFGPNGPLPLHLSEFARDRSRNFRDHTFTAFADTFHHRLLSLFYRAWATGEPAVSFDRPDDDRFSSFVASTCGRGMESFRHRDYMPDVGKLYFAGRLALQTRNAEGLMAIISDFFKVPVSIRQFVGEWLELPEHQLCRLGESSLTGALGVNTTVGRRVWSCQYKFRLIFGPVSLKDYKRLLPGGMSLERLVAIVRNYIGDELFWDVNLILKKEEVPAIRLGQTGDLGWTTWLLPRRDDRHANDLYLHPLRLLQAKG